METPTVLDALRLVVALIGAAVVVELVARRIRLPFTIGLVVAGLVVARLAAGAAIPITPDLVLSVLLPGLIFEAALRTEFEELRPSILGVVLLAVPGVLILAWLVAAVLSATTGIPFGAAFLVGAMVAATDPAAVIATFKRIRAPRRLATIVEAESLLNDGTGIVLFSVALAILTGVPSTGAGVDIVGGGALAFLVSVAGSAVLGGAAGLLASRLVAVTSDHLVELAASVVLAYGSFLLAAWLGWSGIIATVTAGVTLGSYGRTHGLSPRALETIDTVWEFIAFLLSALIFLALGLAISLELVAGAVVPIAWAVAAVLLGRALIVYGLVGGGAQLMSRVAPGRFRRAVIPTSWLHVLFWGGLRGAVSVGLALSLPPDLPDRELLQGITFGVVLFTLFVQGSTADLVVRRLIPDRGSGDTPGGGPTGEPGRGPDGEPASEPERSTAPEQAPPLR
ncbi:MAG TPA: cation:proton antiporter [Candidatus Limnocylindrales bacterium]|jgi:CPA1 family monovalent cation:H+ antiporter|nr:cation:proton antiporter [Candidatus Limnocylindrales bacterium]